MTKKDWIQYVIKEGEGYVNRILIRKEAMTKGDEELYSYSFSTSFDTAKHQDHERLIKATKKANEGLLQIGEKPLFEGNRQEIAKYVCVISAHSELIDYVD